MKKQNKTVYKKIILCDLSLLTRCKIRVRVRLYIKYRCYNYAHVRFITGDRHK